MADFVLNNAAYCKIVLHCVKYPHCAVNGILLAERQKSKDVKIIKIVDTVPLFHFTLGLAPMMEIALTQIDGYCKGKNLVIAGYYHANESFQDKKPTVIAEKIACKIQENYHDACLLMIDNKKISQFSEEEIHKIYVRHDGKWKIREQKECLDGSCLEDLVDLLESKMHRELIDYENHLDDISLDWKNTHINERLERAT